MNKALTNKDSSTALKHDCGMYGNCPDMLELFRRIKKVAQTDSAVLIQGECGTGKELVAKAVHEASSRKEEKLISVNCAAIPNTLIESELFGHEKDAFPGAVTERTGLVAAADKGTLFLDEIAELPLAVQAQLLRVVQDHEFRRVGSVVSQKVDIRLVAATHKDLQAEVQKGLFREDLFYRINVMTLVIPPLRNRGSDVVQLADHKLALCCERMHIPRKKFSADAIQAIAAYAWPGNVRELVNVIKQAVTLTEGPEIPRQLLGLNLDSTTPSEPMAEIPAMEDEHLSAKKLSLKEYFQRFVLEHQGHLNETELAKKLGISRKCLWERRQRFNIPRKKSASGG